MSINKALEKIADKIKLLAEVENDHILLPNAIKEIIQQAIQEDRERIIKALTFLENVERQNPHGRLDKEIAYKTAIKIVNGEKVE